MRQVAILITASIFIVILLFFSRPTKNIPSSPSPLPITASEKKEGGLSVVAQGLEIPWEVAFSKEGQILVTERGGRILILKSGASQPKLLLNIPDVYPVGEGGLLGLTLHPEFSKNGFLYVYFTYQEKGQIFNKVVRFLKKGETIGEAKIIIDRIPGGINHDGGRIKFGPDKFIYITTGDSGNSSLAQDPRSLGGKILRLRDDGQIPQDNPFGNAVYSLGHRNPQGLAWDEKGRLWSTEHGRSGLQSGLDELNLIEKGKNYGWPRFQGDASEEGFEKPVLQSGPDVTWAPSGATFFEGSIFFTGLRGQAIYEAKITGDKKVELKTHFKGVFGRIRTIVLGPDKFLYITTSNRDGRGEPKEGDDKIMRLDPAQLKT